MDSLCKLIVLSEMLRFSIELCVLCFLLLKDILLEYERHPTLYSIDIFL